MSRSVSNQQIKVMCFEPGRDPIASPPLKLLPHILCYILCYNDSQCPSSRCHLRINPLMFQSTEQISTSITYSTSLTLRLHGVDDISRCALFASVSYVLPRLSSKLGLRKIFNLKKITICSVPSSRLHTYYGHLSKL